MFLAASFRNFGCIWSGPDDFVSFNFSRCSYTFWISNSIVSSFWSVLDGDIGIPWVVSSIVRERPFNLKGGGYGFFSKKKYSYSQCCWKKCSDFGGGKK
jgi:hypothetical protein